MLDIYEIRTPVYKRTELKDVRTHTDYLVRKLDSNNRAVASVRVRIDDVRGLEHFRKTISDYLNTAGKTKAYLRTDPERGLKSLGLDVFA